MKDYKQCELARTSEPGGNLLTTVSFIPSDLAIKGRLVELKNSEGKWDTWQVTFAGTKVMNEEEAKKIAKKYHNGFCASI